MTPPLEVPPDLLPQYRRLPVGAGAGCGSASPEALCTTAPTIVRSLRRRRRAAGMSGVARPPCGRFTRAPDGPPEDTP